MNVKVVYFFEYVKAADRYASAALGWTETFYGFDNSLGNLDDWLQSDDAVTYIQLRRACLPPGYRIAWLRISDEANPRSFKLSAIQAGWGTAKVANTTGGEPVGLEGQVNCAVLVDLVRLPDDNTDHTHHRKFLLRALPVDIINGNVINTNAANWGAFLKLLRWIAIHESGTPVPVAGNLFGGSTRRFGLKYQDPLFQTFAPLPATVIDPADPRGIMVTGDLTANQGQFVQIRDVQDSMRALNRKWHVKSIGLGPPIQNHLGEARRALPVGLNYVPPGPGRFRLDKPKYALFNQFTIIGLRNRKTGRLFHQLRGRSPNR